MSIQKTNRIVSAFLRRKQEGSATRIIYVTSGYPDLSTTSKTILGLEKNGVDIIEIGFPFSDPMADGPVIQQTTASSLAKGYVTDDHFDNIRKVRKKTNVALAIMTYVNIVYGYGTEKFIKRAADAGVDGLIIPDLPLEEAGSFRKLCEQYGIVTVLFASSTSSEMRLKKMVKAASGFIYVVSQPGVTGKKLEIRKDLTGLSAKLRNITDIPLAVGFGIETKADVQMLSRYFDGVIIGSAFLKRIVSDKGKTGKALQFVKDVF